MKVEVITSEQFMGDVIGNLNSKRGQIMEMRDRPGVKIIDAMAPLAEMFGYATDLRSMTQGRASYSMEFSHYAEVPANVAQEIIEGRGNKHQTRGALFFCCGLSPRPACRQAGAKRIGTPLILNMPKFGVCLDKILKMLSLTVVNSRSF